MKKNIILLSLLLTPIAFANGPCTYDVTCTNNKVENVGSLQEAQTYCENNNSEPLRVERKCTIGSKVAYKNSLEYNMDQLIGRYNLEAETLEPSCSNLGINLMNKDISSVSPKLRSEALELHRNLCTYIY